MVGGNFDFSAFESCFSIRGTNALCDSPSSGFLVPDKSAHGVANVDAAITYTAEQEITTRLTEQTQTISPAHRLAYRAGIERLVVRWRLRLFYDVLGSLSTPCQQLSVPARD